MTTRRTLDEDLRLAARGRPDHVAIIAGERRVSYAELDDAVSSFAGGLRGLGVARGDRVGVFLPNGVEAAVAIYGILRAGAAFSPLNPTTKADRLGGVLQNAGAVALVCEPAQAAVARDAAAHAPTMRAIVGVGEAIDGAPMFEDLVAGGGDPGRAPIAVDLAALIYTSGSTGQPKGVTLTHQNMAFAEASIVEYLELTADERVLCAVPLSFDYGLYQLLMTMHVGGTLILERGFAFPGRVVDLLEREQVTGLPGVPTMFGVLCGLRGLGERHLPHLRYLSNTGAALPVALIEQIRSTFPTARLYSMYGLTECKRVSYLPPDELDRRPDSVGVAIPGTEVWVEGEDGAEVEPGEIGELMVRGPHIMQGYWNDPKTTAERVRPGRWPWERELMTGDLFRRDDEGFLYFVARKDDVIKSRGEKVAPREIEEVLASVPGVRDVAVLGIADPLLGQAVHAYVSTQDGATLDERALRRHCAAQLEDYKVPQRIFVHDELPKSPSGKVDRLALSSWSAETQATPAGG